jgi:hypothetical protein
VRIRNTTSSTINIEKCSFNLSYGGKSQKTIVYSEDIIRNRAEELAKILPRWSPSEPVEGLQNTDYESEAEIKAILRSMGASSFMGTKKFWDLENFTNASILEAGQETGFVLEHFRDIATEAIDELKISIVYRQDKQEQEASVTIPIIQYRNSNLYTFPLKGSWYVMGSWVDPHNHRMMSSQEFAYDFIILNSDLREPSKEKKLNTEFSCYGEDIFAIADGKLVACYGSIPENARSHSLPGREMLIDLVRKYGHLAALFGNYVIIKHSEGEYSFYGHLIPNSLRIKQGDKVTRGERIGKVGNSGNSEAPHLHFQLMDGPDFLESRGLPCYFTNTTDTFGERMELIDKEHSIVHAE